MNTSWSYTSPGSFNQDYVVDSGGKIIAKMTHPDFRERIERGEFLPSLPYHRHERRVKDPVSDGYSYWNWWHWGSEGSEPGDPQRVNLGFAGGFQLKDPPSRFEDLRLRILSEALDQNVSLGMAFFEAKETFGMIEKRALQLLAAARDVRRGRFTDASRKLGIQLPQRARKRLNRRNRLDQFTENWLEYRYGWFPLAMDIHGACKELSDGVRYNRHFIKVHTSITDRDTPRIKTVAYGDSDYGSEHFSGQYQYERREQIGITYDIIDRDAVTRAALGVDNPYILLYEGIPGSFIFDWFFPVGDFLQHLTAFNGCRFVDGYQSRLTRHDIAVSSYTSDWYSMPDYAGSLSQFDFRRELVSSFGSLRVDPFRLRPEITALRALDAVSLLQGALKGRS